MGNLKLTIKHSINEEDGSRLAMSALAQRQKTGQPSAKIRRTTTIDKVRDTSTIRTSANGLVTPPKESELIDLSLEVTAKPICKTTNDFPLFSDGDVFIDLGLLGPVRYQIHSTILMQASSWFDETLAQPIEEFDNKKAANQTKRSGIRARYELSFNSDLHMFVLARATLTEVKKLQEMSTQHAAPINTGSSHPSNAAEKRLDNEEQPSSNTNANVPVSSIQQRNSHSPSATPVPRIQTSTPQSSCAMSPLIETQGKEFDALTLPLLPKVEIEEPIIKQEDGISTSALTGTENPILGCEDHVHLKESQTGRNPVPYAAEEDRIAIEHKQAVIQKVPFSTREAEAITGNNQEVTAAENRAIDQKDQLSPPKDEVLAAYKCLFSVFYARPINIDTNNINEALRQVEAVIRVAELYGCIPVVRAHLANSLLQYGRDLYAAILQDPPRWFQLSLYLESAPIFKEAAVHMIGNLGHWPWSTVQIQDFPGDFRGLFQRKVVELKFLMADTERKLFTISMDVSGEEGLLAPTDKRIINTWYVVQLWKQWFSQAIPKDKVPKRTKRSDGTTYRLIAKGGDAYVPLELIISQVTAFREPIHLTTADKQGIEKDLKMIKAFAQKQVDKLCANKSMLSPEEAGIEHLTCLSVDNDDIPWLKEEVSLAPDVPEALKH